MRFAIRTQTAQLPVLSANSVTILLPSSCVKFLVQNNNIIAVEKIQWNWIQTLEKTGIWWDKEFL